MAVAPDAIHLVESVAEVEALPDVDRPVALLAQTTLSHREWAEVADAAKRRFPDLWQPGRSDLCFATTNRQSALMAMAPRCDAIVVIGSANSSNTRALERLAREAGCPTVLRINGADELPDDLPAPSASPPAPRRPRSSSTPSSPASRRRTASRRSASPTRTSTSRRPRAARAAGRHRRRRHRDRRRRRRAARRRRPPPGASRRPGLARPVARGYRLAERLAPRRRGAARSTCSSAVSSRTALRGTRPPSATRRRLGWARRRSGPASTGAGTWRPSASCARCRRCPSGTIGTPVRAAT